ncbi:hypothetical protein ACQKE0_02840 [Shewanella colwelliana]|uniref:hypothetical protein n=1 Tax=Shewanella colwelliana TaxID=23 RepID=UPI003D01153F
MFILINYMTSKIFYLFCIVFLSVILYGVKLSILPLDLYRIFYILSFVLFCFCFEKIIIYSQWGRVILICFIALFFSLLISLYTKSNELVFIRMVLDYFLTFLFFIPVVFLVIKKYNVDFLLLLIHVVFFQSIVMFVMVAFPSFQKLILNLIDTSGIERTEGVFRFRGVGLTGLATYSMAVTQSFGLFLFHYYWKRNLRKVEFLKSTFMFVAILLSSILSARTSFLFIVALLLCYFIIYVFSTDSGFKKKLSFVFYFMVLSVFLLLLLLGSIDSPVITKMLAWSGEFFISLFSSGNVSTDSTDALKGLFFIPKENTILFGDGQYLSSLGEYYMSTDVGYLRVVLYGGIIGSLSFYAIFIYLFYILMINSYRIYGLLFTIPLFFYSLCVFVVNFKGSIFFDGFIAFKLVALVAYGFSVLSQRTTLVNESGILK